MNAQTRGGAEETRVLVVEDDRGIAESLVRGLRQAGYGVEGVRTGRAALSAPTPDVVLLDLGLPDIDGVELCRRLRARSDAAIIAVTARGEEADRVVALDEGADDYLVKPFGLAELLARIRAVLRRRRPAEHIGPAFGLGSTTNSSL
jgi:DNA-binding response OmpR family regulator